MTDDSIFLALVVGVILVVVFCMLKEYQGGNR
jgi:hypothetical protein